MSGIVLKAIWLFFCHSGVLSILITPGNHQKCIKRFQKHKENPFFWLTSIFNVLESAKAIFKITAGESVTSGGLSQALIRCFGFSMPSDHELPLSLLSVCMSELTFFYFSKSASCAPVHSAISSP